MRLAAVVSFGLGSRASAESPYPPPPEGPMEVPVAAPNIAGPPQLVTAASQEVTFGDYTSVQVNVSGIGMNIVGDAANEPSIAVNPTNPQNMVIGWRQFDTILNSFRQAGVAYTFDGGATWTFPGVIDPGQFRSDPVLGADANGYFYYSSLSTLEDVEVFRSTDGGVSWPVIVDAFGGDKQWMAVDDRPYKESGGGNIYQIWNVQFTCCWPDDVTWSIDHGMSFPQSLAVPTPSMKWGTMDTGPDGTLYLAGRNIESGFRGQIFARSSDAFESNGKFTFDLVKGIALGGETGGFGSTSPNPGGLLGQVWIVSDPTQLGRIFVLGTVDPFGSDRADVKFIKSVDNGHNWTDPIRVNNDAPGSNSWQWFGSLSVAPNGRLRRDLVRHQDDADHEYECYVLLLFDGCG